MYGSRVYITVGNLVQMRELHASTNFAIAIFLILLLRRRYRWVIPVMLVYAFIMAYSRIYLGVHYPGDILAGVIIGGLLGLGFGKLTDYAICWQCRCEKRG